jgi:hypothetical protein
MDRKTSPERIARILQGLDADVIGVKSAETITARVRSHPDLLVST